MTIHSDPAQLADRIANLIPADKSDDKAMWRRRYAEVFEQMAESDDVTLPQGDTGSPTEDQVLYQLFVDLEYPELKNMSREERSGALRRLASFLRTSE
jgi:hypothetical protein